MRARLAAVALALVLAALPAAAPDAERKFPQAAIPEGCRAVNVTGRQCVWCALESIAAARGCDKLSHVTRGHPGPVYDHGEVGAAVRAAGEGYASLEPAGPVALCRFLGEHVGAGRPVAIEVYAGAPMTHCLVCVGYEPNKRVALIDNVPFGCAVREYDWNTFWTQFRPTGWAFTLTGDKR